MIPTATCGDCSWAWRGPSAHEQGGWHTGLTGHTVWYDQVEGEPEEDREGTVEWEGEGIQAGILHEKE